MPLVKSAAILLVLVITALTTACQTVPRVPGPEAAAYADISPMELRDTLAALARAHEQKMQLVFYLTLPWINVETTVRPAFTNMGTAQNDLDQELHQWADEHHIDLFFRFSDSIADQAQKKLEDQQQQLVTSDGSADLTRDSLIQMSMDYQWQVSVLQALMPKVRDPKLLLYLQKSLKVHQDGSAEFRALLRRFKFS
jgi:hypothetical protein